MLDKIYAQLDQAGELVLDIQSKLVSIPAIGPDNGGKGERDKADYLLGVLKDIGVTDVTGYNAPDDRVPCGHRPNIKAIVPGKNQGKTLWIIGHMDVVPAGDISLWDSDPFEMQVDGDVIVGRGVEDNQQAIVSGLILAKAFLDQGVVPDINLGLLFVADEETGSKYGLDYMVGQHADIFKKHDLFLIPDFGEETGEIVEVAEKSILNLKVTTKGKQCHASAPEDGKNAMIPAAELILKMFSLYQEFPDRDDLFDPPMSTFEPTKKLANVDNVNTIPGLDVFYVDCRVLPGIEIEDVVTKARQLAAEVAVEHEVEVEVEASFAQKAAPPTPVDSEIVVKTIEQVRKVYQNNPRPVGIGGGTVAAFLRSKGYDAAVWSCLQNNPHQPNEKALVSSHIKDAKVMAGILGASS